MGGLTVTAITVAPTKGTAVINPDGTITYTANPGSTGVDVLTYEITDSNGNTDTGTIKFGVLNPVCFTAGTLISTSEGKVPVEQLAVGDLVKTLDRGLQSVRWVGIRKISGKELVANPHYAPIRIRAGAIGTGIPKRDLLVSPQHRIMVSSKLVERMFGEEQVLVAAKQLLQIEGMDYVKTHEVTYVHFMCDQHEIVFAESAPTETLYLGAEAIKSLDPDSVDEIFTIFPELRDNNTNFITPARLPVKGSVARKFASRAFCNGRRLIETTRETRL